MFLIMAMAQDFANAAFYPATGAGIAPDLSTAWRGPSPPTTTSGAGATRLRPSALARYSAGQQSPTAPAKSALLRLPWRRRR